MSHRIECEVLVVKAHRRPSRNGALFLAKSPRRGFRHTLLVFSEPRFSSVSHGRVGQALRGFDPALEVFNVDIPS